MNRRLIALLLLMIVTVSIPCLYVARDQSLRTRVLNPSYYSFIKHGGSFRQEYMTLLMQDPGRSDMVRGKSLAVINAQYPFLVPANKFSASTYKGKNVPVGDVVLWLSPHDGFDWCVVINKDSSLNKVMCVKG